MPITQKDIARELGISFVTVNRAFNNSGYVSEALKKRILDYAKKRSYIPHRASQVLVRNKIRTIAVFSSSSPEYFWADIKKGVFNAGKHIKPFNYEVHYHRIPDFDTARYCRILKKEIKQGLDAAAFVNQRIFDMKKILALVEKAEIPYLMYNVDAPETGRLTFIGSDYRAGGRLAANFIGKSLNIKGTGKVLVIGFIQEHTENAPKPDINSERLEGFLMVMRDQYPGVSCKTEYVTASLTSPQANDRIEEILAVNENRVDAVYFIPALNDAFHRGLVKYDYKNTITVQHDIDDSALDCLTNDLLTAVVFQDPVLQGYTAVRALEHILESNIHKRQQDVETAHTLVFKENVNFLKNHYLLSDENEKK
ncbi:LacI family transcriptional regulator [Spirochaetia bacterium]|nr:LacI family transcriptional regulator [Spirochaetia bacterium]